MGGGDRPQTERERIQHFLELALDEAMACGQFLALEQAAEEAGQAAEVAEIRIKMAHSEHLIWQYLGRLPGEVGHVAASVEYTILERRGKSLQDSKPSTQPLACYTQKTRGYGLGAGKCGAEGPQAVKCRREPGHTGLHYVFGGAEWE